MTKHICISDNLKLYKRELRYPFFILLDLENNLVSIRKLLWHGRVEVGIRRSFSPSTTISEINQMIAEMIKQTNFIEQKAEIS